MSNADEYAQDLRHLIVCDTQFGWSGATTLKLPDIERLVARGWLAEGDENAEYDVTEEGHAVIAARLRGEAAQGVEQAQKPAAKLVNKIDTDGGRTTTFIRPTSLGIDLPLGEYPLYLRTKPVAVAGDAEQILPPEWISEQIGGEVDDLTPGQAWRNGFNQCRYRAKIIIEQRAALTAVPAAPDREVIACEHCPTSYGGSAAEAFSAGWLKGWDGWECPGRPATVVPDGWALVRKDLTLDIANALGYDSAFQTWQEMQFTWGEAVTAAAAPTPAAEQEVRCG